MRFSRTRLSDVLHATACAKRQPANRACRRSGGLDLEITWRAALTPWLALQPDLQYIRHSGGAAVARHATLIGARIEISF